MLSKTKAHYTERSGHLWRGAGGLLWLDGGLMSAQLRCKHWLGYLHHHHRLSSNAFKINCCLYLWPESSCIYSVNAGIWRAVCLQKQVSPVMDNNMTPVHDPDYTSEALATGPCTIIYTPTFLQRICQASLQRI